MLSIQLLGHPIIHWDGQPLIIQRRILRAMLFYMACQSEPVGRQDLILLFWPEENEEKARRQVRDTLSKLRNQLPCPETITTIQDMVLLNPEAVRVDVRSFQQLVRQIHQTSVTPPFTAPLYQQMVDAVGLWRTPRFLAGADLPLNGDFDEWVTTMQRSLDNERRYLLQRLSEHEIASHNLDMALHWLRAALETDPLNPYLHIKVLNCLETLERYSEAVNHCQYVKELFHQELQSAPPDEILQISKKLQSHASSTENNKLPYWPSPLTIQTPFVGHNPLLQVLKMAYARGGSVLLRGESGSGKTRIGYELLHRLEPTPRLLLAVGRPLETNLPYQPLIDLLREVVHPQEWDSLAQAWKRILAHLMPEISGNDTIAAPLAPVSSEFNTQIYEAIHQIFIILSKKRRVILFLDDAQWVDKASLAVVAYLIERNFFEKHGLLLMAARLEENNPHLEQLLLRIQRPHNITPFDIELLQEQEVLQLSRHYLGYEPATAVIQELVKNTGGNPLYILETLRAMTLLSSSDQLVNALQNLPGENKLRLLVRARLSQVTPRAREVLTTAAVIGNVFPLDLLEKTSQMEASDFLVAVEVLEQSHLIRPARHVYPGGSYAFIHEKIREILLQELKQASQRAMHLRVACAMEKSGGNQEGQSAVIAHHLAEARQYTRAFHYWLISADYAWNLFSQTECYKAFENAEKLFEAHPDEFSDEDIYQLYSRWGEVSAHFNDLSVQSALYDKMKLIGEKRKSALLVGSALNGIAQIHTMRNQVSKGLQIVQLAIPYLEETDHTSEIAEAYTRLGTYRYYAGYNNDALTAFEKALSISENVEGPAVQHTRITCENMLALSEIQYGLPDKALETAIRSLQSSERIFYLPGVVRARSAIARALLFLGRYREALESTELGIEMARSIRNLRLVCYHLNAAARIHLALGNIDEAWDTSFQAQQIAQQNQFNEIEVENRMLQGDIFRMLDAFPNAIDAYQRGLFSGGSEIQTMDIQFRLGISLLLRDPAQYDMCLLKDVIAKSGQNGLKTLNFSTRSSLIFYYLRTLQIDLAQQTVQELEQEFQGTTLATLPLGLQISKGYIGLAHEQPDTALTCAYRMMQRSRELENPFSELAGIGLAADTYKKTGQHNIELLERAQIVLNMIAKNTQNPVYRAYFEQYRQKMIIRIQ